MNGRKQLPLINSESEVHKMYELVIIWANGEREIYEYKTEEAAEKGGQGVKMALGNQVAWWCVRKKVI